VLDTQKERLDLRRNVRVSSNDGQEARLASASIDLKTGAVVSDEPVTVTLQTATIEAKGVEVLDGGRVIHFKGRVSATLTDPGPGLGAETSAPGARGQTSQAEAVSTRR
jgi:lipopolysaccharide export system protein LptC